MPELHDLQLRLPGHGLISFKEMPKGWKRRETAVMEPGLEAGLKLAPLPVDLKR